VEEKKSDFIVRFWGVRGSHPVPGASTVGVGGNTSCVEILVGDRRLIIDAGTGIIGLGRQLAAEAGDGEPGAELTLLISHTHHDHTQGFPFFRPVHDPGTQLHVFGPRYNGESMADALNSALLSPYFPVQLDNLTASLNIGNLEGGETITFEPDSHEPVISRRVPTDSDQPIVRVLRCHNHPGWGVLVFRVTHGGRSVVYASDIEGPGEGSHLVDFCAGSDILIHDAEYLPAEYDGSDGCRKGYGHSTFEMACDLATRAAVGRLFLYHFSPEHDDRLVARMERAARSLFPGVAVAREGLVITL